MLRSLHIFYWELVMSPLQTILLKVIPSEPHKRILFNLFVNYFIFVITVAHYAVCLWIYIGGDKFMLDDDNEPWILANSEFLAYTDFQLYVFTFYWIYTVISTVGYGDYSGGTRIEYIICMIMELFGLVVFSILMYIIT